MVEHKNGEGFAAFPAQIAATWPDDHPVLGMDTVSDHRSPAMRAWGAERHGRIIPFRLPASTPNLNLIERVWRFLTHGLACHRFWNDIAGLEKTATALLDRIEARFHTPNPPAIRLIQNNCKAA